MNTPPYLRDTIKELDDQFTEEDLENVAILLAKNEEPNTLEAGETLAEYALILLMILGAVIVLFSLVGVNIVHIMVTIWNFFFWR